jgi:ankyrin repeat protein
MITRNIGAFKNKLALKVMAFIKYFFKLLMRMGLRLRDLFTLISLIILVVLVVVVAWLTGWKYNQTLSYVPFAGTKPEEKHAISEAALFIFLHDGKTTGQLNTTEAEMLDVLKDIDKASKITEVEIHQSSMGPLKTLFKAFHVFNVFRTTSESDGGNYWWSLEKNMEYIILQRSRKKDDVKNKLYGKERKQVKLFKEDLKGKGSIKNLFAILLSVIREPYNIWGSNCQSFVSYVSKRITEIGYDFKGVGLYSVFPDDLRRLRDQNANLSRALWQIIHLANDIPVTDESYPSIIDVHWTDLVDEMIESGNYDINALYGGFTSLHFALLLDKYEMVRNLLKPPLNADPTTRDSRFGVNALHLVAIDYSIQSDIIDLLLAHPKVNIDDVNQRGRTALHFAARVSNVMVVEKLLEKGANPNIGDNEGLTPLHLAARRDTKTVNIDAILEAQKAKRRHVDEDKSHNGWTALHHAADSSNEIMAEHLIDVGADVNARDNDGLTPFHVAALKAKNMQIIDSMLWKMKDMNQYRKDEQLFCCAYRNENLLGAEIAARLKRINSLKENPQSWIDKIIEIWKRPMLYHSDRIAFQVVMNGFPQLGRLRITYAKNAQEIDEILKDFYIDQSDENGETPLFFAIRANNVIAVRRLLERGADPTRRNNNGLIPIQVAATQGKDFKIIDLLLEYEYVDIDDGGQSGYTLLHWAMATSNVTTARFLLSKGANPNVADRNGATPLHVAAYCADKTDVLGLILEKEQVDINRRDKNGQTVLHYAIRGKRVKNVGYLLENGADPAIRDENGDTPVHLAAAAVSQDSAILELLLSYENKPKIDERNNAGMTAPHVALKESNVDAARFFLLSKGANPADENGLTTLDWAANFVIDKLPHVTMSTPWTTKDQICYITHSNISRCKVEEFLIL